jgi:cytochrome c biogenesis protein CcmG, thiol:disulfide interchange protein DsbE
MQKPQRYLFVILGILGLASSYLIYQSVAFTPRTVNYAGQIEKFKDQGVPDFSLPVVREDNSPNKSLIKLSEINKPAILINFWATWCAPCIIEFPSLVQLAKRFQDKGLIVIAISIDEDATAIQNFLTTTGIKSDLPNFYVLSDSGSKVASQFGTVKIPETYIVGPGRKLLLKSIDKQDWMAPEFIDFMEKRLEASP